MKKLSHGCTLDCADCCKFNVYVEYNKVIKIEGDKEHPYTKGFICKKGLAHLDRLNHRDRIYKPLLKEEGQWKEIAFNEAISIMAEKLNLYKKEFGSKSILYYEQYGNGSLLKSIGEKFLNFYGGASFSKGGPCWSAGIAAQKLDFGESKSHSLEDMLNSKNIFVWGKNPANTTIHTMKMIRNAKANGSKIIVIDPIETASAKLADIYIRVNVNGDLPLALAMAKVIIEENIFDQEYINRFVNGFDDYKKYILSLEMQELSNDSGVAIEDIIRLAKLYGEKYSTILLGFGIQKYKNGGSTIRAIDALGAITGQIGFSGGGINYANKVYPRILNLDPYNSESFANNRYFYTNEISDFIDSCNNGKTYYKDNINDSMELDIPIKMAIITKSNILNQLPNLNKLKESLSKIEFKVCFDMFMTDTAKECDLFIPTTNTLESEDLLFSSMMNPYLVYNEKLVEINEKLMDEYYFFMELAKRLNINEYPCVDKKTYLEKVIEPLNNKFKNISLDYIKDNYITIHNSIAWEDKKFLTNSGKFEIVKCDKLKYKTNDLNKIKEEKLFRLLTNHGKDSLSSQHFMDEVNIAKAYINSRMANKLELQENEVVSLKSKNGQIRVQMVKDDSVSDYVVMMYVGWWEKNGNPNYLTNSDASDIGGQIAYNETFVNIIK